MDSSDEKEAKKESLPPRISFDQTKVFDQAYKWRLMEQEFLAVFLGYDYDGKATELLHTMLDFVKEHPSFQGLIIKGFLAAFEIYAAIENLFSNKHIETERFARSANYQELLMHFFIRNGSQKEGLPQAFLDSLDRAVKWYPKDGLSEYERLNQALFRIYKSYANMKVKQEVLRATLFSMKELPGFRAFGERISNLLDEITQLSLYQMPALAEAAIQARYHIIDNVFLENIKTERKAQLKELTELITLTDQSRHEPGQSGELKLVEYIVNTGHYIVFDLVNLALDPGKGKRQLALELLGRRFTRDREFISGKIIEKEDLLFYKVDSLKEKGQYETLVLVGEDKALAKKMEEIKDYLEKSMESMAGKSLELIVLISIKEAKEEGGEESLIQDLYREAMPVSWCCLGLFYPHPDYSYRTFTIDQEKKWQEDPLRRSFDPLFFRELRVNLLAHFHLKLLYSSELVKLVSAKAKNNPADERFLALVEISESRAELSESK